MCVAYFLVKTRTPSAPHVVVVVVRQHHYSQLGFKLGMEIDDSDDSDDSKVSLKKS